MSDKLKVVGQYIEYPYVPDEATFIREHEALHELFIATANYRKRTYDPIDTIGKIINTSSQSEKE